MKITSRLLQFLSIVSTLTPWIITTCMGRKSHVQQTLPASLRNTAFGVVLVDYSCPEDSGGWAEETFPREVASGRLIVERVVGNSYFHKTAALNQGARVALQARATHLCFVDADTHLLPGFGTWTQEKLGATAPRTLFISALTQDGREIAELYGLLLVEAALFEAAGGYAEEFLGWGCEDFEMRLRLVLCHEASICEIPHQYLAFIQHPFDRRSTHYNTKDWSISNSQNLLEVGRRVQQWTGKSLRELEGPALRLGMQRHPVIYIKGQELQHFAPLTRSELKS